MEYIENWVWPKNSIGPLPQTSCTACWTQRAYLLLPWGAHHCCHTNGSPRCCESGRDRHGPALSPQTNLGTVRDDRSILLLSGKRYDLKSLKDNSIMNDTKKELLALEMIQTGSQLTSWERCVWCRILHHPLCYVHNTEVVYLASSEQNHILYEILRTGQSLNWIFPWFQ